MADATPAPELAPFFASGAESRYALGPSARALDSAPAQVAELLVVRCDQETFGLPISAVVEICRAPCVTPVPWAQVQTLGIMSLRGLIVPVVDLPVVLRLAQVPGAPLRHHRVVIVRALSGAEAIGGAQLQPDAPVGLRVGGVLGVVRLPAADIVPRPYGQTPLRQELVAGLCTGPHGMIGVLDVAQVLAALERL